MKLYKNLKYLRNEKELTQKALANILNVNQSTYKGWESGFIMIPIIIADKLSVFYNVRLSSILGIEKISKTKKEINPMNYTEFLKNINKIKKERQMTFKKISVPLKCSESTCCNYFLGKIIIPMDRLILLANFYNVDLDKLCGKE